MFETLKARNILLLAILISIVFGIAAPAPAYADSETWAWIKGFFKGLSPSYVYDYWKGKVSEAKEAVADIGVSFFNAIIRAVTTLILLVPTTLAAFSAGILGAIISPSFMGVSFTGYDNPLIREGWGMVRDLANMVIVLGFVVVGVATALRVKEYEAKKVLLPLIITALLINFSRLICGIVIDAANIAMEHFFTGGTMEMGFINTLSGLLKTPPPDDAAEALQSAISLAFFNSVVFVVFLLYAFLFALRYVALWTLVILAPLAFVFRVFSFTRTYYNVWLKQFIMWSFVGVPAAFFFFLGNLLAKEGTGGSLGVGIAQFFVPSLLLLVGFFVSLQTGAIGAKAAVGAGKAVFKGSGKVAGGLVRRTKTGQKVSQASSRLQERVGLKPVGSFEADRAKRIAESRKRVAQAPEEVRRRTLRRKLASSPEDRVAAFESLAKEGKLSESEVRRYAPDLKEMGLKTKEIKQAMPTLAPSLDTDRVRHWESQTNPATGNNYTTAEAEQQVIRETLADQSPQQVRKNIRSEALKDPRILLALDEDQIKGFRRGSHSQKQVLHDLVTSPTERRRLAREIRELRRQGRTAEARELRDKIDVARTEFRHI